MAIQYTWTVSNTEFETTSGSKGIVTLHWRCTAVDGDHSVSSYGTTSHTPDPSSSDFIAYDSVTESNPQTMSGTPWAA
jgi:hypothetical protein